MKDYVLLAVALLCFVAWVRSAAHGVKSRTCIRELRQAIWGKDTTNSRLSRQHKDMCAAYEERTKEVVELQQSFHNMQACYNEACAARDKYQQELLTALSSVATWTERALLARNEAEHVSAQASAKIRASQEALDHERETSAREQEGFMRERDEWEKQKSQWQEQLSQTAKDVARINDKAKRCGFLEKQIADSNERKRQAVEIFQEWIKAGQQFAQDFMNTHALNLFYCGDRHAEDNSIASRIDDPTEL